MVMTAIYVPVSAASIEPVLMDDFLLEGKPYAIENMTCVESEYDSLAENGKYLRTRDPEFEVWMLREMAKDYDYDEIEYNMIPSERNKDASLTYYNEDFGGKTLSIAFIYREELVKELVDNDWWDWKGLYHAMPFKLYAGETLEGMTELTPDYFKAAGWYPDSYLDYIVEELPAGTKYIKAEIPALDSENYDKRKIARVLVTEDKSVLNQAYVNTDPDYDADDACEVTYSRFFLNGKETDTLGNGDIYGLATVHNERSGKFDATLFTALYKNNELYEVKSQTKAINSFQTVIFSTKDNPLNIPEGEDASAFNARLWVVTDDGAISKAVTLDSTVDKTTVNPDDYEEYKIAIVYPEYRNEISGDTLIKLVAPGFEEIEVKCWQQDDTGKGHDVVEKLPIGADGYAEYMFHADEYPHGPLAIRFIGIIYDEWDEEYIANDVNVLQVYNLGGVPFQEGLEAAPFNPIVGEENMKLIFEDDFEGELSIARWDTSATYSSHKITFGDYSGLYFRDFEDENLNPFGQIDTYMRIRSDEANKSAGLISTMHQDRKSGIQAMPPAYYECRFIAQYATGTWPAFWFVNNGESGQPGDELDPIEAYGFEDTLTDHYDCFHAGHMEWGRPNPTYPDDPPGKMVNMRKMSDGSSWFEKFHTYAMYMGKEWTVFYLDNEEMYRFHTTPSSLIYPTYPMFNMAVGGSSGWPIDLSKYGGVVDMYVDWIRVYAAE